MKVQRDLLTGIAYHCGTTLVANRQYGYDSLGRPTARNTSRQGTVKNDTFGHNNRSELTSATVNGSNYAYDYDNIGNRETATESDITRNYTANELNQYTAVGDFTPTFDANGNQTLVKTSTGIWSITYDAENRPVSFTNAESNTVVECAYDHMGRRATKKVTVDGAITLHQRYLYRGYLQIACCDLIRSNHPCLWLITWDPTQPIATRPLAIQKDGSWYTYGWDLTKNICELYGTNGYIRTAYTYTPYGEVTESANSIYQPIQWSSEYNDTELGLVYYNYRHYNPMEGRWLGRDKLEQNNMYIYINNTLPNGYDYLGNDRGIIAFNLENLIHYTLVIDEWFIENGKYKRSGYFHYDFRALSTFDNIRTTLCSVANVSICYIHSFGVVEKTHTWNKIETFRFKKTTPCNDIALMKELDKEIGKYMFYNVLVRNCISWTRDAYYSKDHNSKCCNPDGTLYEE